MQEERHVAPGQRIHVTRFANRIVAVKSATGRTIGHAIGGLPAGPNLLVAGTGPEASAVFDSLLRLPGLGSLRGRLILLSLDRLDDKSVFSELDRLAGSMPPIKETLFLCAVALDDPGRAAAQTDALLRTVIRFCGWNGLHLFGDRPGSHLFRT